MDTNLKLILVAALVAGCTPAPEPASELKAPNPCPKLEQELPECRADEVSYFTDATKEPVLTCRCVLGCWTDCVKAENWEAL